MFILFGYMAIQIPDKDVNKNVLVSFNQKIIVNPKNKKEFIITRSRLPKQIYSEFR